MSTPTLKKSYLVQRLRKPRGGKFENVFSFGGGLKNGGLSEEAMELLTGAFSFDYMGASEYEWGAVPEALSTMANAKLTASSFDIDLSGVPGGWRDDRPPLEGTATIYVLCPADVERDVKDRIYVWSRTDRPDDLRDHPQLNSTLRPFKEWDGDVVGWLELDNGFMFFTDREMWEATCTLFGVETTS